MPKRIPKELRKHDYFFIDFFVALALLLTGILSLFVDSSMLDAYGTVKGFMYTIGSPYWQFLFICSGIIQGYALIRFNNYLLRGVAYTISSFLFLSVLMSIIIYGPYGFNFSTVGWLVLTAMAVYGLARIISKTEQIAIKYIKDSEDKK